MIEPHIQVENLTKVFGRNPSKVMQRVREGQNKAQILAETGHTLGLRNVNLTIEKGQIFVIMGLSGSGKSTLIRHFNRLIEPTAGRILVNGEDVMQLSKAALQQLRRNTLSMVFQRFGLLPHKTIIENVAYGLTVQRVAADKCRAQALKWLDAVGLSGYENQYPAQLSGGQQQRVGLARALCTDAEILLMDEPYSALDPLIRNEMQEQLITLQAKLNKTIIFITHDLDEALRLGDRIAILIDGEVSQEGTPEDILLRPATPYVAAFVRDVNRARALTVEAVMEPPTCRITGPEISAALHEMQRTSATYGYYIDATGYQGVVNQSTLGETSDTKITSAMIKPLPAIALDKRLEEILPETLISDYEYSYALPVIDANGHLRGQLSRAALAAVLSVGNAPPGT